MKPFLGAILLAAAATLAAPLQAATFEFDMTFDGWDLSLDPGSADPGAVTLHAGDGFRLDISAASGRFWRVEKDYDDIALPMDFLVNETAHRRANVVTRFFASGVVVETIRETGILQSIRHIGAERWLLDRGLSFDRVSMEYELLRVSSGGPTTIDTSSGQLFGFDSVDAPFFRGRRISFSHGVAVPTPVPLPASLPLSLTGIIVLVLLARWQRRRRQP